MKTVIKSKLYYDKYKYRATLYHQDFHHTRYAKNKKQLIDSIEFRIKNGGYFFGNSLNYDLKNTTMLPYSMEVPLAFLNWKLDNEKGLTIRTDYNMVSVYGNDLELLKTLETIGPEVSYTQIIQQGDPDVLLRNNPNYQYRTYFKSRTLPDEFHDEIGKFLSAYSQSITPCGSLKKWAFKLDPKCQWKKKYLEASFFIEYDNESLRTLLALNFDKYLGKTYKVEQR